MSFFLCIKDVIRFMQLPKMRRKLTFYSEGKNYWPYLEGLVKEVLKTSDISVCYISSGEDDPGLNLQHVNYSTFKIDEGFVRNWFFENIETDVMVMTMPDINQFQVKRSKHKVHYVYVQHSLVSLHMIYRKGAFDYYDTIFCAGPHHIKEIRAMELKYNLPTKNLVKHGYARLDSIMEESNKRIYIEKSDNTPLHILIAPTWGPQGVIESGLAEQIIDQLIKFGYHVTLRPHPQTIKLAKNQIRLILHKYKNNRLFNYEANIAGQESLHKADLMISDWSGVALDYALGLNKPVIFLDIERKINNREYKELNIEPFEVQIRDKIGSIMRKEQISELREIINITRIKSNLNDKLSNYVFNVEKSALCGCIALKELLQ